MSAPFASIASPRPVAQSDVCVLFYLVRRVTPEGMKKEGLHMIALHSEDVDALKVNALLRRRPITSDKWPVIFDLVWRKLGVSRQPNVTGYYTPHEPMPAEAIRLSPNSVVLSMIYQPISIHGHYFAPYQAMLAILNAGYADKDAVIAAAVTDALSADQAEVICDALTQYIYDLHIAPLVPLNKAEIAFTRSCV